MRQPPSLADRVLAALPRFEQAPLARDMAARLNTDEPHVRQAFERLESEGRAKIVRRGRRLHLVPADYPGRLCVICKTEFHTKVKRTKTCGYSCGMKMAWQTTMPRDQHRASVLASRKKPGFKEGLSERWRDYYADPENRAAASEREREKWQDINIRGKRLASIDKAWESPERREKQAKRRLKDWANPEFRDKTVAAMRTGKRGMVKRRAIELASANPLMTAIEIATRLSCKVDRIIAILRKARRESAIGIRPGDGPRLRKRAAIESEAA